MDAQQHGIGVFRLEVCFAYNGDVDVIPGKISSQLFDGVRLCQSCGVGDTVQVLCRWMTVPYPVLLLGVALTLLLMWWRTVSLIELVEAIQKGCHSFYDSTYTFPTGCTEKFGLDGRAVSQQ